MMKMRNHYFRQILMGLIDWKMKVVGCCSLKVQNNWVNLMQEGYCSVEASSMMVMTTSVEELIAFHCWAGLEVYTSADFAVRGQGSFEDCFALVKHSAAGLVFAVEVWLPAAEVCPHQQDGSYLLDCDRPGW